MEYKANIWKMYLFSFLVNFQFVTPVLVPFLTDWGMLSFTKIMILQSWFALCLFLLEIPTGTIADKFGRKYSLFIGAIFGIAGTILYGSIPNFWVFFVAEFLIAVGIALFSGADEALVYDTLKKIRASKQSKKVFGRIETYRLAGILAGAPIGGFIAVYLGLPFTMILSSISLVIALLVALGLKEPTHVMKVRKNYFKTLAQGVRFFYKNKILQVLAFDSVSIGFIAYFMIWLNQPLMEQAGIDLKYFGIFYVLFLGAQIAVLNNFEYLEKFVGSKKRLLFLTAITLGVFYIVAGSTTYAPLVIFSITLSAAFGLTRRTLLASYMNKYITSSKRATVLSTISMLQRGVLFVVNPIVGVLIDKSLNMTLVGLGILALIFAFVSRVEERHLVD